MSPIITVLASVLLGVAGQLLLKSGLNRLGPLALRNQRILAVTWRIGANPLIWAGLGLYGASMLFWLTTLSQVELGYAYPFISLSYVLILGASWAVFREEISLLRVLGVAAICLGVYVVASG
jgi:drug/metabolite transporter (DMT)-like permease